jgi:hypothetical protein
MKYGVKMDSGVMIYIPSFIKIGCHSKVDGVGGKYTDNMEVA